MLRFRSYLVPLHWKERFKLRLNRGVLPQRTQRPQRRYRGSYSLSFLCALGVLCGSNLSWLQPEAALRHLSPNSIVPTSAQFDLASPCRDIFDGQQGDRLGSGQFCSMLQILFMGQAKPSHIVEISLRESAAQGLGQIFRKAR